MPLQEKNLWLPCLYEINKNIIQRMIHSNRITEMLTVLIEWSGQVIFITFKDPFSPIIKGPMAYNRLEVEAPEADDGKTQLNEKIEEIFQ